jgi:hypothetical protein
VHDGPRHLQIHAGHSGVQVHNGEGEGVQYTAANDLCGTQEGDPRREGGGSGAHAHNKHTCKLYTNETNRAVDMGIVDWPQPRSWWTWPSEQNVYAFHIRRSHSISFTRAQGIPKYKLGFGGGKHACITVQEKRAYVCRVLRRHTHTSTRTPPTEAGSLDLRSPAKQRT